MKSKPLRRSKSKKKRHSKFNGSIFQEVSDLQIARRLWAENKRLEAAKLFLEIVDDNPSNVPSLVDASRALGELFDYVKARELLKTATAVGARSANANFLAGQTYRMLRQYQLAVECFTKAIELDPAHHTDARLELAILLERKGRLDEAQEQLLQRQTLVADDHESAYLLARIHRRRGEWDSAKTMLKKLTQGKAHPLTKVRCYCELSTLHEQQQDYPSAWAAMLAAKSLSKRMAPTGLAQRKKRIENYQLLSRRLTQGHLDRWRDRIAPSPSHQTILLTGLPRSGTTLLAKLLHGAADTIAIDENQAFPRFCLPWLLGSVSPESLTLEHLDQVSAAKINQINQRCLAMMLNSLEQPAECRLVIDKNPSFLPILVPYLSVFARSRLLLAVRDPRDVLMSCLFTYMPANDFAIDMLSVENAVQRIKLDYSIWLNLKSALNEESWLETRYEKIAIGCDREIAMLRQFLGMSEDDFAAEDNQQEFCINSPSYEYVNQPVYQTSIGRWKNYEQFLGSDLKPLHELSEELSY